FDLFEQVERRVDVFAHEAGREVEYGNVKHRRTLRVDERRTGLRRMPRLTPQRPKRSASTVYPRDAAHAIQPTRCSLLSKTTSPATPPSTPATAPSTRTPSSTTWLPSLRRAGWRGTAARATARRPSPWPATSTPSSPPTPARGSSPRPRLTRASPT